MARKRKWRKTKGWPSSECTGSRTPESIKDVIRCWRERVLHSLLLAFGQQVSSKHVKTSNAHCSETWGMHQVQKWCLYSMLWLISTNWTHINKPNLNSHHLTFKLYIFKLTYKPTKFGEKQSWSCNPRIMDESCFIRERRIISPKVRKDPERVRQASLALNGKSTYFALLGDSPVGGFRLYLNIRCTRRLPVTAASLCYEFQIDRKSPMIQFQVYVRNILHLIWSATRPSIKSSESFWDRLDPKSSRHVWEGMIMAETTERGSLS